MVAQVQLSNELEREERRPQRPPGAAVAGSPRAQRLRGAFAPASPRAKARPRPPFDARCSEPMPQCANKMKTEDHESVNPCKQGTARR